MGNVKEITISPDGSTLVTFNVIKKYSDRVREDSQASIGLHGPARGQESGPHRRLYQQTTHSSGRPVASVEPLDITQLLAKAGPSLEDLQKILHNMAELTDWMIAKRRRI